MIFFRVSQNIIAESQNERTVVPFYYYLILVNLFQLPHVYLSCIECYTPKLIYEFILNNLSGNVPSPSNDWRSYAKCDNMADFILLLKKVLSEQDLENETTYIVSTY